MKYKVYYKRDVVQTYFKEDNCIWNLPEDVIHYTINLNEGAKEGTITARIENPSQHTLYLIEQGRCFITINCKNFIGHSGIGYHSYSPENGIAHKSGLGRGSYRFHKHWSICTNVGSLLNNYAPIKVTDPTNIEIPIHFQLSQNQWDFKNVKGYCALQCHSDKYSEPYRNEFYFDIRLALLTACQIDTSQWADNSRMRVYQTHSPITRITFKH